MSQPQDIVWNVITDSAKTRFDYAEFERMFADSQSDDLPESILTLIISCHVMGDSTEDIAAEINTYLVPLGISFADDTLTKFISDRQVDLSREIKAMKTALPLFKMGLPTRDILALARSILVKP